MTQGLPTQEKLDVVMDKAKAARHAVVELVETLESMAFFIEADRYKRQLMDLDKNQIKLAGLIARCRDADKITVDDYK